MTYSLTDYELYLFNEGTNAHAYRMLGAHRVVREGKESFRFAVWAPSAHAVSVVGNFNSWNIIGSPMTRCGTTGVWVAYVDNCAAGDIYKYAILGKDGETRFKADPYALRSELRPNTASVIWELPEYSWSDSGYISEQKNPFERPMSIYEVHLGSFLQGLGLRELSEQLVGYAKNMGYTHIELMPVSEHPLDMSWGYQVTGYYAVSSRYGTPEDLMLFVDRAHQEGIGVILDWVPAHFPNDAHGLKLFDGAAAYENPDPRLCEQPQWGTTQFDYGCPEVRSFLISNAVYFLKEYHIDGLRVDAVSCMLYLDYGRREGEWLPNRFGGRENLEAIGFLKQLSAAAARECPSALLIAEESTAFPLITKPPETGGLGFHFKWNMGWMNDVLSFMGKDSVYRKYEHSKLTFSMHYAFSENYVLPFSHDEVVHGKHSLIERMPGDYESKFAQLRTLFMYQFAHPGAKLMFMGSEFGQFIEWDYQKSLDWFLLDYPMHASLQRFVRTLNGIYCSAPPLYQDDHSWEGFKWLQVDDSEHSVLAFMRTDLKNNSVVCVFNFTSVPWDNYRIRLPYKGKLSERINSNQSEYGGTDWFLNGEVEITEEEAGCFADIRIPHYGGIYFTYNKEAP